MDHKPKSTTALRRLDNIAANPRVSFLVDAYTEDWDRLWWVRADAVAEIVDGPVRLPAVSALRAKYPSVRTDSTSRRGREGDGDRLVRVAGESCRGLTVT